MARTALITGATGGLGGAVVDRFAREGWSVLGVDKRPGEDWENVRFVEADLNSGRLATGGYWVPAVDGTGVVKAGDGAPGRDVDAREAPFPVDPEEEGWVSGLIRRRLPGFDPSPTRSETCIYTMTPDQDFVLDRRGAVVVGSPCSGHGFKFGPLLGELLADLATQAHAAPYERFALARFLP